MTDSFIPVNGTSRNKNWSRDYGPDVDRAKKAKKKEVQKAIDTLADAEGLPVYFEAAEDIIEDKSLAKALSEDQKIVVMTSYYAYLRRKSIKDEEVAIALLLM